MASSLIRRSEFSGKPTSHRRFEGIVIAFGTLERAVPETDWPRCNLLQDHLRLAAGTARALNSGRELLGRGHDASLDSAGA
jgi:hypothetical protein